MHLGFSAASAVVTAPSSPDGSTYTLRCPQDFVARDSPGGVRFPRFGVLAGRDDRGGPTGGDGVVTPAGVEGTIGSDAGDLLFGWDLIEQFGQHRRIPDVACSELGGADFQRFLVNSDVDLAPDAASGAPVLARVPFPFALDLDPGAVDQEMQRTIRSAIRNVDLQGLLAARQRAEVGHLPVQTDQPQQALDEAGRLPERHPKQNLHRQAGLDRGIAVVALSTTLAGRRGFPGHGWVKPDRQRAAALERFVVAGPVPGLVGRGCRSAHGLQLSRWIHDMNPLSGFVQQSRAA